jgi:hypothetical protein
MHVIGADEETTKILLLQVGLARRGRQASLGLVERDPLPTE